MKKFDKFFGDQHKTDKDLYIVKADIFGRLERGYTHAFNEKQARIQFIKETLKKKYPELSSKGFRDAAYRAYEKSNASRQKKIEKKKVDALKQAEFDL